jgi:hypothetical protein
MTEAIFGLIGVLVGSIIPWLQTYWTNKRAMDKNAKYLAIRVVCILDKYVEDCAEVVKDDGLSLGQRTSQGYLQPQVEVPVVPVFPEDIDWKSIEHELMYKILSLPSEIEGFNRIIKATEDIAYPPDYEDWFNERAFYYCQLGLRAYKLSGELCTKYSIKKKIYNDWDPETDLKKELVGATETRQKRIHEYKHLVNKVLGPKYV